MKALITGDTGLVCTALPALGRCNGIFVNYLTTTKDWLLDIYMTILSIFGIAVK